MKRRQAFTLVELMVSMALIIFIMAILSQAFVAALGTFRNLKGQGDLAEKLRSTMQMLQHDLAANHFESNRRLSDPTFWNNGPPQQGFFQVYHGSPSLPGSLTDPWEGADTSGIGSYRSTDHALAFTVRLVGNNMGDFMTASALGSGNVWLLPPLSGPVVPQLPGNPTGITAGLGIGAIGINPTNPVSFGSVESRYQPLVGIASTTGYNYQWAEVEWFLKPQTPNPTQLPNPITNPQDVTVPDPTSVPPTPLPLYTLYRRQRLLVPDNNLVTAATIPQTAPLSQLPGIPNALYGNFLEMSCWPNPNPVGTQMLYFNSPTDITVPTRRLGGGIPTAFTTIAQDAAAFGGPSALAGSDIQVNDVVSFDVRLLPLYSIAVATALPATQAIDPFVTLFQPPFIPNQINPANPAQPFTYTAPSGLLPTAMVFDTWTSVNDGLASFLLWATPLVPSASIPYWTFTPQIYNYPVGTTRTLTTPITGSGPIIRAVQVTLRIWDYKTNQTRQVTIVQAL